MHNDSSIVGNSQVAEKAFKEQYPAVYAHLLRYKKELSNRNKAETGIRYEWYALQRFGSNYMEDFEKEKIAWVSVGETHFCLIPANILLLDTNYFTVSLTRYHLALLNSKIIINYLNNLDTPIGGGGAYRHYKYNFEQIPIPKISEENQKPFIDLADEILEKKANNQDTKTLENQIDELVYKLYELKPDEINIITEATKSIK